MLARTPPPLVLTPPGQREHELQIECTKMLHRILLPAVCWTAIDHAHSFDKRKGRHGVSIGMLEAWKRKRRGIKPGIPDYAFWHARKSFAIELKVDGPDLSDDQEIFLRAMIGAGVEVSVCWSLPQVLTKVRDWGLIRGGVSMAA